MADPRALFPEYGGTPVSRNAATLLRSYPVADKKTVAAILGDLSPDVCEFNLQSMLPLRDALTELGFCLFSPEKPLKVDFAKVSLPWYPTDLTGLGDIENVDAALKFLIESPEEVSCCFFYYGGHGSAGFIGNQESTKRAQVDIIESISSKLPDVPRIFFFDCCSHHRYNSAWRNGEAITEEDSAEIRNFLCAVRPRTARAQE